MTPIATETAACNRPSWFEGESGKCELGEHGKDGVEDVDWKGVSTNVMRHGFHFVTQIAVQLGCKTEKAKHAYKDGDGAPVLKLGRAYQK